MLSYFYITHKNILRKPILKISKSGIERLRLSVINLAQHVDLNYRAKLKIKKGK